MRVSAYMLGFVVFLILHASSSAQTNEPLEPIEIAIGEWKPFVTQTVDGYGELTEIVTVVLERMGYRPKYIFMPWGQAENLVAENEGDIGPRATFPFIKTEKRRRTFFFSAKPIFEGCLTLFYNTNKISRSEDISISTIADLVRFKLGFVSKEGGYQYPPELTEVLKEKGTGFRSLFEAFNALVDSRTEAEEVQVVPAIWEVGHELLYEFFPEQRFTIAVLKKANEEKGNHCWLWLKHYFLASKRNPNSAELMTKFDMGHDEIIDSGMKSRIKQKRPSMRNPEVVLSARDSPGGITGRDANGLIYYLPRGTRGLLLKWSPASEQQRNDLPTEAEVRVTSGPHRGKTLIVDGKFVVLQ